MMDEMQVKKELGIEDFRHLSKEKVMKLASMIPNMDQMTQRKVIEQFPQFAHLASSTVSETAKTANSVISENHYSASEYYTASRETLDALNAQIYSDKTSSEDKKYYAEKSMEVLKDMSAKDSEDKAFLGKVLWTVASVVAGVTLVAGAILGVTYTGNNLPRIGD